MRRIFLIIFLLTFTSAQAQDAAATPVDESIPVKNETITFMYLAKVKAHMPYRIPEFGWRVESSFPVRVKEFLLEASHVNFSDKGIQEACAAIEGSFDASRRKNSLNIVKAVREFINENIKERVPEAVPSKSRRSSYYTAAKVLAQKEGNDIEKCRLAVAMLRHLKVPAQTVGLGGSYDVEYFVKPLEGDTGWYLMGLTGAAPHEYGKYVEPIEWYPITADELLDEEWQGGGLFMERVSMKSGRFESDYEAAKAVFDKAAAEGYPADMDGATVSAREYYVLREITYRVYYEKDNFEIDFTMPFNNRDTFKKGVESGTFKAAAYMLSTGPNLRASYKRAHTFAQPPQEGMIYYLPVKFEQSARH